ncbi:hypothetical protein L7F22_014348 [Adiantum nelumboides]|nr:hypothetical protein [Adiantum nelumboides]
MAMGRSKAYRYMQLTLKCSRSPSSGHSASLGHPTCAEPVNLALQSNSAVQGFLLSQVDCGSHVTCTLCLRSLGFAVARGPLSQFCGTQGRNNNFVAVSRRGNPSETVFSECGVRFYRGGGRGGGGGGRGRGRTSHDFDNFEKDYASFGESKGFGGRDGFGMDNKDDAFPGDYRKFQFDDEEEEEKPENGAQRLAYMRNRERETMLQKFTTSVVDVNRTFKVTKGGGEVSFTALVICGNGDGLAGWAKGKGPKAARAVREASIKALNNLYYFERFKGQTIYHYVEAKYEKTKVRLWPEWTLGEFRAGGVVRGILRHAGIKTVKAKMIGSSNPYNAVKATFLALSKIKTPKEYEEKYWRAVVERHLVLDADGKSHPKHRKVSSSVL